MVRSVRRPYIVRGTMVGSYYGPYGQHARFKWGGGILWAGAF